MFQQSQRFQNQQTVYTKLLYYIKYTFFILKTKTKTTTTTTRRKTKKQLLKDVHMVLARPCFPCHVQIGNKKVAAMPLILVN